MKVESWLGVFCQSVPSWGVNSASSRATVSSFHLRDHNKDTRKKLDNCFGVTYLNWYAG